MKKTLKICIIIYLLFFVFSCAVEDDTPEDLSSVNESFSVGGTIVHLNGSLVIQNNGSDETTVVSSGEFKFQKAQKANDAYFVSIKTQPEKQSCFITNGSGTISDHNISNILIDCATYVEVILSGLHGTVTMTMTHDSTDDLVISNNGSYTFETPLMTDTAYTISIDAQPKFGNCLVTNGSGTIIDTHPPSIPINCSTTMIHINGGSFQMGDLSDLDLNDDEKPVHTVTLDDFFILDHEVTMGEYLECVNEPLCPSPDTTWDCNNDSGLVDYPANCISWYDAQEFVSWLNANSSHTYRLCTESEWEYSARAGTTTAWSCGNESCLDTVAWYLDNNVPEGSKEVGTKASNDWDLYDMHGNVWEWVSDWYGIYPAGNLINPKGPDITSDNGKVVRGGNAYDTSADIRTANRFYMNPNDRPSNTGFRVCADVYSDSAGH